jgi:hypothetical protein
LRVGSRRTSFPSVVEPAPNFQRSPSAVGLSAFCFSPGSGPDARWWGEATDEPARADARPTGTGRGMNGKGMPKSPSEALFLCRSFPCPPVAPFVCRAPTPHRFVRPQRFSAGARFTLHPSRITHHVPPSRRFAPHAADQHHHLPAARTLRGLRLARCELRERRLPIQGADAFAPSLRRGPEPAVVAHHVKGFASRGRRVESLWATHAAKSAARTPRR